MQESAKYGLRATKVSILSFEKETYLTLIYLSTAHCGPWEKITALGSYYLSITVFFKL